MWRQGSIALSDVELIALILGTGVRDHPAIAIAEELVRSVGGMAALARASPRELAQINGVGTALATRMTAAFELGRRAIEIEQYRDTIGSAEDIFRCVAARLAGLQQELFLVVGVDVRNRLLDIVEVARGSVCAVAVSPREVFRPLIRMAATGGVLVHNHPSGDPTPSLEDVHLTRRLRAIGLLLEIPIIDHVVVAGADFRSLVEWAGPDLP